MSKRTENNDGRIRSAMDRLLAGQSLHTDGKLHVKNLAAEAGLTRQQVYRSPVLTEFNEHLTRLREQDTAPTEPHLARIHALQEQLKQERASSQRYRVERDEARARQEVLANQILVLDAENELLRASRSRA